VFMNLLLVLLVSVHRASAASSCPLPATSSGAQLTSMTHGGVTRSWYTYVPPSVGAAQGAVPLVVDLHGQGSCAMYSPLYTGWLSKATEFGFLVAWPQALDEPGGANAAWNAGPGYGEANDVDFLREMVGQVVATYPIDSRRIYFTGHSNGAMMAQRMLAQASDMVAAAVGFAGYLMTELGSGYTPRPVMLIHGTADINVPYDLSQYSSGAEESLAAWGGHNGCPGAAPTISLLGNYTLHEIDCDGVASALVELPGVGHFPYLKIPYFPYPANAGSPSIIDTTQLAWEFLKTASNDCPKGCVSSNARQRRRLLFGTTPSNCPKGCFPA